jgi:hypothetical protein
LIELAMEPTPQIPVSSAPVLVNTSTPKTVGVLNIVFGALLILCGLCSMASMLQQAAMGPMMEGIQEQQQETMRQVHQAQLDELDAQIAAAESDEERAELQAQRDMLAQRDPAGMMPNMGELYSVNANPLVIGYSIADGVSGLLLNGMLIASGIGLLNLRSWSRTLALWTLGLKIARLVLVYGFMAIVVGPYMAEAQGKAFDQMLSSMPAGGGGGPPPQGIGDAMTIGYGIMYTGLAIAMIVFGSIYPAIALWLLSRPGVKAACSGRLEAWESVPPLPTTGTSP